MGRNDVSSKKRAGRSTRRRLRQEAWAVARRNRAFIVRFLATYLACVAAAVSAYQWWGYHSFGWFLGGVLVGFLPAFVSYFLIAQGIANRQMGGDAESWTADELEALDRRTWRVFHDVPVRYGNVDHVAIGPGRVYAIETKWTSSGTRYLESLAGCAQRQAQRLTEELGARGAGRQVVPLLVVWGPKVAEELEKPKLIGETRVVAGSRSAEWLEKMASAADRFEIDLPAARAVETLIREEGAVGVGSTKG